MAILLLPALALAFPVRPRKGYPSVERLGNGYPGRVMAYETTPELQALLDRYQMTAGWFRRAAIDPEEYFLDLDKCPVNELPFILYKPKHSGGRIPMVIYFGGSGEHGTDLMRQFHHQTVFAFLTSPDFQKRHPCYVFAPMFPEKGVYRGGLPGRPSCLSDLACDTMYAVIRENRFPPVDTNRLYLTGLSYGGGVAFELPCLYPGRFAAALPVSSFQSPAMVPEDKPVDFWLFHNEDSYLSPSAKRSLAELDKAVRTSGGDFRVSVFPESGHNAWDKAWREEGAWEWLFSKTANGQPVRGNGFYRSSSTSTSRKKQDGGVFLREVTCTASTPGKDERHGPERAADNLDDTCYISAEPMTRSDWWMAEFPEPVTGKIIIYSGTRTGEGRIGRARVETSEDGRTWRRRGSFKRSTGACSLNLREGIRFLRILPDQSKPEVMILREIFVEKKPSR